MTNYSAHDFVVIDKFLDHLWAKGIITPLQDTLARDEVKKLFNEAAQQHAEYFKAQEQENPGRVDG